MYNIIRQAELKLTSSTLITSPSIPPVSACLFTSDGKILYNMKIKTVRKSNFKEGLVLPHGFPARFYFRR